MSVTYYSTEVKMVETILNVVAEEILGKLISLTTDQINLAWGFKEHIEEVACYAPSLFLSLFLTSGDCTYLFASYYRKRNMVRKKDRFWEHVEKQNNCRFKLPKEVQEEASLTIGEPNKKLKGASTSNKDKEREISSTSISNDDMIRGVFEKSKAEYIAEILLGVFVEGLIAKLRSIVVEQHISFNLGFKEGLIDLLTLLTQIQLVLNDAEKRQASDDFVRSWLAEFRLVAYDIDDVLDELGYNILQQKVLNYSLPSNDIINMANKIKIINESLNRLKGDIPSDLRAEFVNLIPEISFNMEIDSFLDDSVIEITETLPQYKLYNLDNISKVQPLFVRFDDQTIPEISFTEDGFTKLRTLVSENVGFGNMLSNFKCLRVLKLSDVSTSELPHSIEQLIHLRFLHISRAKIVEIPKSITKLYNLQTLRIEDCCNLTKLPEDLSDLINLRHIYIDHFKRLGYKIKMPENMGRLSCLHTLPFFFLDQDGHLIKELGQLNNLRGELDIYNLQYVRGKEEARSANLAKNAKIFKLGFHWGARFGRARDDYENDEEVLEGLKPHRNLKSLTIKFFKGAKFPSWMFTSLDAGVGLSIYNNLIEISLKWCNKCEEIPTLGHLPCLRVLQIEGMNNVRCVGIEFYSDGNHINTLFPALRRLKMEWMDRLEEWKDAKELTTAVEVFPCLEELTICSCRKLTSLPHTCVSLQELVVQNCLDLRSLPGVLSLLQHLEIKMCGIKELPSGLQSCRSLQHLEIDNCFNLRSIPNLGEGLHSLIQLRIWKCPNLISIPNLQELPSLRQLEIWECPNLTVFVVDLRASHSLAVLKILRCGIVQLCLDGFDCLTQLKSLEIGGFCEELNTFPSLASTSIQYSHISLEKVELYGWPKLNHLPDEIQHFTALKYLDLYEFDGIEALSDWLGNLSSLQKLYLVDCKNLMYLPTEQAMGRLTKLETLEIINCPKLEERCAERSGAEWSKIARIPNIIIMGNILKGGF
ncbi:hypothetical protein CMV_022779 [Castanea mollissima]|uniref:Rx N-terminal domain-containing protein n=1 Tax=Castanea mollissima TaxID=60419 RepID=A0A8J4QRK7_9ROSI|nr:hypothetical protein CMV_022779 [Castanea mollissima]